MKRYEWLMMVAVAAALVCIFILAGCEAQPQTSVAPQPAPAKYSSPPDYVPARVIVFGGGEGPVMLRLVMFLRLRIPELEAEGFIVSLPCPDQIRLDLPAEEPKPIEEPDPHQPPP